MSKSVPGQGMYGRWPLSDTKGIQPEWNYCRVLISAKDAMQAAQSNGIYGVGQTSSLSLPKGEHPDSQARDTFAAVAHFTMGMTGVYTVNLCITLTLLGAVAVYLITISALLHELYPSISQPQFVLAIYIVLVPFACLRDLAFLSWASLCGVACYFFAYMAIFWYGSTLSFILNTVDLSPQGLQPLMQYFGVVTFSIGIPVLAYSLQESMAQPKKFVMALDITMVVVCIAYICIGLFGMGFFTHNPLQPIQPIIISNLPSEALTTLIVKLAVCITLLLTAPLSLAPALNMLENMIFIRRSLGGTEESQGLLEDGHAHKHTHGHSHNNHNHSQGDSNHQHPHNGLSHKYGSTQQHYDDTQNNHGHSHGSSSSSFTWFPTVVRVLVFTLVTLLALSVPCFTLVMSVIGCFTLSILCFILPPIFYLRLYSAGLLQTSLGSVIGCYAFVFFGAITMVVSTFVVLHSGNCGA